LSFKSVEAKVGNMQFQVSEDTIAVATEIHARGEKWFKRYATGSSQPEFRNTNFGATIPKELLLENHSS
jgi:hypothetical protein